MTTTTTTTRRIAAALAVATLLAGGRTAAADEPSADPRPGLTLGGRPLAEVLHADPTVVDSRAGYANMPTVTLSRPGGRRGYFSGRAIGTTIGAVLGVLGASAVTSHCSNEGGSSCWQGYGLVGLGAWAGYGISGLFSKLRGASGPRTHGTPGASRERAAP